MEENKVTETLENEGAVKAEEEKKEEKTYSEAEVMKLLQSESDRRVTQALEKQKKQYERKLSLSQLDDEAREKAEKDDRIAELEEKVRQYTLLQNKTEVIKVLNSRGLNAAFADLVEIGEDVEEAQKKIEQLDKLFKNAVAEEVKRRLAGSAPKESYTSDTVTKKDFEKMTLTQQANLYKENPELYKQLTK